jgi:hypothetical protein
VVAASRRVDLRGATELGKIGHQRVIEHSPLAQVLDERAVGLGIGLVQAIEGIADRLRVAAVITAAAPFRWAGFQILP